MDKELLPSILGPVGLYCRDEIKGGVSRMEFEGLTGKFLRISEVISKLAYVNLLWILFTILGFGLLGFMPATVALFAVTRKWVIGEQDIPVFSTYWKTYRREFLKSNLLGIALFVIGFILYVDLAFLPSDGIFYTLLRFGIIICSFLFFIVLLYIFPVYVHYDWKNKLYLKYALLLGASYPHFTFSMIVGIAGLYFILMLIPGIIPLFSISILAYITMWVSYRVFKKVERTQTVEVN